MNSGNKYISDTTLETLLDLDGISFIIEDGYWVKFKAYTIQSDQ